MVSPCTLCVVCVCVRARRSVQILLFGLAPLLGQAAAVYPSEDALALTGGVWAMAAMANVFGWWERASVGYFSEYRVMATWVILTCVAAFYPCAMFHRHADIRSHKVPSPGPLHAFLIACGTACVCVAGMVYTSPCGKHIEQSQAVADVFNSTYLITGQVASETPTYRASWDFACTESEAFVHYAWAAAFGSWCAQPVAIGLAPCLNVHVDRHVVTFFAASWLLLLWAHVALLYAGVPPGDFRGARDGMAAGALCFSVLFGLALQSHVDVKPTSRARTETLRRMI